MLLSVKQRGILAVYKAAIRAGNLKQIGAGKAGIASAESHAKRLDPVAQKRVVIEREPIAWSKAKGPLDYVEAFKAHKRETGAGERANAALAIEFKAVVSPDWLAEGGADPRDPGNPRVRQLVAEAQAWAESWGGKGAVWAVRYDTDEKGAGVVDLFMSPVREQRHKSGKTKLVISTGKAKDELLAAEKALDPNLKTSGAAMQSSWARWCQQKLDARLERGRPKAETGRDHIHAEIYARAAEEAKAQAKAEADKHIAAAREEAAQALAEAQRVTLEARRELEALRAAIEPLRPAVEALEAHEAAEEARKRREVAAAITKAALPAFEEIWDDQGDKAVAFAVALTTLDPEQRQRLTDEMANATEMPHKTPLDIAEMFNNFSAEARESLWDEVDMNAEINTWDVQKGLTHLRSHPRSRMAEAFDVRGESFPAKRLRAVMDQIKAAIIALGEHLGLASFKPEPPPKEAKPLLDLPKTAQDAVRDALTPKPKPPSGGLTM